MPIKANVAIIDLLPKTREEYSSVFKREGVSQGAEAEMASSEQVIQNTFGRLRHRADDVVTALPDVSADIVVIIGHNESGLLRTPSGKIINIFEASRGCLTAGKFCIFLTCRSADYLSELQLGVTRDLGIVEASRIAKEISESMGRERLIEVPRTSREQIQGVAASFQLADPQGAMSRLTKIVAGQRRSIYLGFIERGVFIIVAAILVGDDE